MGEENTGDSQQNPETTPIPPVPPIPPIDNVVPPTNDIPPTNTETGDGDNENKEPVNVVVNLPADDKRPQITANKIAIWGLVISLVLAIVTYLLFRKTIDSNKTATDALEESRRANDISE